MPFEHWSFENERFEHEGVELAYEDHPGAHGDGDVLVLLHGLGLARSTWSGIVPAVPGGWRVLALDHRGHGDSAHAPGTYTLGHYVADAIAFCEEVAGRSVVMAGHSLGGLVAASVAQRRPELVRALLLEDPPLYRRDPAGTEDNPYIAMFSLLHEVLSEMQGRQAPMQDYVSMLEAVPSPNGQGSMASVLGDEGTRARARALASLDPGVLEAAVDGSAIEGATEEAPIRCPVRLLRADAALRPAFRPEDEERLRSVCPHAHVEMAAGASHFVHDEQPQRFLRELDALAGELGGRGTREL